MGYTAGTLDLSILGASDSAVASIDRTVKSLNSLSRAINKVNNTQFVLAGQKIEVLFNKIAKATNSINVANLQNLASAAKSLASISKIGNLEKMDYSKVASGFGTLTTSITPFITKVKEAEASLIALYGVLNKTSSKKINNLSNADVYGEGKSKSGSKGSFNNFFKLSYLTLVLSIFRRIGSKMADIVTAGSDFGETLNLWTVAMGQEFLPQATEFVNKLNEAYGISKETLMNSQAIFKNMLGSLGEISSAQAYALSEGITQMALDYASLYNVKFEDAMTKFQAALAGQVRPIRSVAGYDITENTLFQLYQELGGTKTMRQLSRTEKQLLAIYAVFEQMERSGAVGDLKRTINSFANQSRVMADSWKEVQTYAGLTVTRILEQYNVMKYINAVLIFMSRILEGLATSLDTGLGNSGDVFGNMENGALGANEAVEDLQNSLLDFDKFRALDQSSGIGGALGIDQTILDAMTQYDSILENATLEARKLADAWLESLGFVDANNDGIIDIQNGIDELKEKIRSIDWGDIGKQIGESIKYEDIRSFLYDIAKGFGAELGAQARAAFINPIDFLVNLIINFEWEEIDWQEVASDLLGNLGSFGASFWDELLQTNVFTEFIDTIKDLFRFGRVRSGGNLYAEGGLPDKGTMFVAGEAGAEMVYNMPSGQSGVANVQQIAQATYSGTMRALNDWWGGSQAKTDIPQLREANPTGLYQAVTGVAKTNGKVWANV